jgi:hypothetical protein
MAALLLHLQENMFGNGGQEQWLPNAAPIMEKSNINWSIKMDVGERSNLGQGIDQNNKGTIKKNGIVT